MTPLDYFWWSADKEKFYDDQPHTIEHLNICDSIANIRPYIVEKVRENWSDPMRYCEAVIISA